MKTSIAETISFGRSGNSGGHVITGWSEPEGQHTWSVGRHSSLWLNAPKAPYGFLIEADWHPALNPPFIKRQIVRAEINGRPVKSFSIERRGYFAFVCPPLQRDESRMVITFHYETAFCPSDVSKSTDGRLLAICFRSIRLLVLQEPWQTLDGPLFNEKLTAVRVPELRARAEDLTGIPLENLLHRFEMLSGNCDMGLALREMGFEKLSLLRFGGASVATSINGLESNFAGIGKRIKVSVANNPMKEWMVSDELGLLFHTGQSSTAISEDLIRKKFPLYVEFLRQKFIEDLNEGEKILVFSDHKDYACGRSLEDVLPLFLALRRCSKAKLLWVCPSADDPRSKGSVQEILPGLALGQLDLLAPPVLLGGGMTVSGWLTVLCNAWRAFGVGAAGNG